MLGELGHAGSELSLLLVDDASMTDLNDRFRGNATVEIEAIEGNERATAIVPITVDRDPILQQI